MARRDRDDEFRIPKRWLGCPCFGDVVEGTRFVPMKTPLGLKFDSRLFDDHRFTPGDFVGAQEKLGRYVCHIISFANTSTRYDEDELGEVSFTWLRCGKEAPSDALFREFMETYRRIVSSQPEGVIAIHCTHGFNRTGFIIIRWIVECLKKPLLDAIDIFKRARPPGVYKADYLQRLFDLYKLEGVSIPIVPKPDAIWAFPDPSHVPHYQLTAAVQSDTEETEQIGQPISSFLREVLKERVGRMANHRIGYFPGSQPVSLGRGNLQRLRENPTYRATYKSDGTRYLLLSHDGGNYLIDRKFAIYKVNVLLVNRRGQPLRRSLFDGELVNESRRSGRKCYTFLIFDILEFEEFNLINNDWDTRMDYVSKGVVAFREMLAQRDPQLFEHEDFGVACKRQWKLNQLGQLESFIDSEVKHDTDGIIFTPLSMLYIKGTCEEILKWKPITLNSVDFIGKWHNGVLYLAVRMFHPKDESEDIPVSVLDGEFNMQYLESLDKAVIECAFDVASGAWKPMRTRSDKTTPNAYEVFVSVYDSIKDNITVQSLQEEFGVEDGPGW